MPLGEANTLLSKYHYLGPMRSGGKLIYGCWRSGVPVGAQVFKGPTARLLPRDGVLELSRWVLTPMMGKNGGSRMHARSVAHIKAHMPEVMCLVSYSDPSNGHRGELYRACNWLWAPTWHRLRPPPSGLGSWDGVVKQSVKDRWVFPLVKKLPFRDAFAAKDSAAVRRYLESEEYRQTTHRWKVLIPWSEQGV